MSRRSAARDTTGTGGGAESASAAWRRSWSTHWAATFSSCVFVVATARLRTFGSHHLSTSFHSLRGMASRSGTGSPSRTHATGNGGGMSS